jgi:hypothetical protein
MTLAHLRTAGLINSDRDAKAVEGTVVSVNWAKG